MSLRTPAVAAAAGLVLSGTAADVAGDEYANTGKEVAIITNAGASPCVITIDTTVTAGPDELAVADRSVTVAAGATKMLGPYKARTHNDGDGRVQLAYDQVDDVTIQVIQVNPAQ